MKKSLIVGNWKMNLNVAQSLSLLSRLDEHIERDNNVEVALAPTALSLHPFSQAIKQNKFLLAAQNAYFKDEGAYTGEISFTQLRGLIDYVLIGHSERRFYFNEDDNMVRDKTQAALRNGISPIVCVGENSNERTAGQTKRVLHDQVTGALNNITSQEIEHVAIAYDPAWSISTFGGKLANPKDVEEALDCIHEQIFELYGKTAAESVRILYGGSVDDSNAASYLALPRCNGFIVGGASLNYKKFAKIVEIAIAGGGSDGQDR